jgi:hypothetical protein
MNQGAAVALVLLAAVVAANLPFLTERLFIVGPRQAPKPLGWRLVELLVLGGLVLLLGFALESRLGQRHAQGWEFYAAALCLFVTFAFPGFVWRYLRRHHGRP